MAPAAGKTGTSHDVWFAGYTSNLLCIIWVGNDDYTNMAPLSGAIAAAPIWAEFMKAAIKLPQYSDTREFVPPAGVTVVTLDKETNLLADASCPNNTYNAAFLDGTEPTDTCDHLNGDQRSIFQKLFGLGDKSTMPTLPAGTHPVVVSPQAAAVPQPGTPGAGQSPSPTVADETTEPKKKRGFFSKLFGGKGDDKKPAAQPPPQPQQSPPQQ
jgi:penicillin-binding protein 1B